jgi:hypothetical protein
MDPDEIKYMPIKDLGGRLETLLYSVHVRGDRNIHQRIEPARLLSVGPEPTY